jgi:hypothetical protein
MRIWEVSTQEIGFSSYYLPESEKKESFVELMNNINDENKPLAERSV